MFFAMVGLAFGGKGISLTLSLAFCMSLVPVSEESPLRRKVVPSKVMGSLVILGEAGGHSFSSGSGSGFLFSEILTGILESLGLANE